MRPSNEYLFNALSVVAASNSPAIDMQQMMLADATASIVDATPAAKTFVFASGNNFTITAHGYPTGLKVVNTNSGGALPTGLSGAAEYVIAIDANTVAFATSLANAQAGTAITISGAGSGTQTSTPQAIAGTIKLQKSNDVFGTPSPTWFDITSSSQAYPSLPGTLNWPLTDIGYAQLRAVATTTSGLATVTLKLNTKGA